MPVQCCIVRTSKPACSIRVACVERNVLRANLVASSSARVTNRLPAVRPVPIAAAGRWWKSEPEVLAPRMVPRHVEERLQDGHSSFPNILVKPVTESATCKRLPNRRPGMHQGVDPESHRARLPTDPPSNRRSGNRTPNSREVDDFVVRESIQNPQTSIGVQQASTQLQGSKELGGATISVTLLERLHQVRDQRVGPKELL